MSVNKIDFIKEVFDLGRYICSKRPSSKLTMIQLRTVMFVSKKGIVKPTEIANKFAITPASVTSQIDNLVKEGWLQRKYNQDDKRVIEVLLTEKGKRDLEVEIKKLEESCSNLFENLTENEQKQLLELSKKTNQILRA
jgi:DNA-binding MarR family transcriptional regulator